MTSSNHCLPRLHCSPSLHKCPQSPLHITAPFLYISVIRFPIHITVPPLLHHSPPLNISLWLVHHFCCGVGDQLDFLFRDRPGVAARSLSTEPAVGDNAEDHKNGGKSAESICLVYSAKCKVYVFFEGPSGSAIPFPLALRAPWGRIRGLCSVLHLV